MTIEIHDFPDGSVIGFNGTVEWALDDVGKDEAVWLPREDQLRDLLGDGFRQLQRVGAWYEVSTDTTYVGDTAEEAYGLALLAWLTR